MLTRFQINAAVQTGKTYPATLSPAARPVAFMRGAK